MTVTHLSQMKNLFHGKVKENTAENIITLKGEIPDPRL